MISYNMYGLDTLIYLLFLVLGNIAVKQYTYINPECDVFVHFIDIDNIDSAKLKIF